MLALRGGLPMIGSTEMERVECIVVGGGLAGLSAAYGLAASGHEVMVLERGDYPGAKNVTGGRLYLKPLQAIDVYKRQGVYFSGAKKVAKGHPFDHLGQVVNFALSCLGNGVIGGGDKQLGLARAIGIAEVAMIVVLAVVYISGRRLKGDRAIEVAAGLAAFGVMGAVATAVSRLLSLIHI